MIRPAGISIAVCGQAGHGKSTLLGRLLRESGSVTSDEVRQHWERAPFRTAGWMDAANDFNPYNWLVLQGGSRISRRGKETVVVAGGAPLTVRARVGEAEVELTPVSPADPANFEELVLRHLHAADFAILVVDAASGLDRPGRRLVALLDMLGVPLRAVLVSRMDTVDFSRDAFLSVRDAVRRYFGALGLEPPGIVPVHALADEGCFHDHPRLGWHRGTRPLAALWKAVDAHVLSCGDEPRFATRETFLVPGVGASLAGTLESGILRVGDEISVPRIIALDAPPRIPVRTLEVADPGDAPEGGCRALPEVAARRSIVVGTSLGRAEAERLVRHGVVLGHAAAAPTVATRIEAEVLFFHGGTVRPGSTFAMRAGACTAEARLDAIGERSEVLVDPPVDTAVAGTFVRALLHFDRPVCLESEPRFARLGRFVLRERSVIAACGRCVRILR